MVGFELLSPALLNVLNHAVGSDNLNKYLYYNDVDPLSQATVSDPSILLNKNVFPAPFDSEIDWQDCVQLRAFFLDGSLNSNMVVDGTKFIFDIICAKSLWLIHDSAGDSQIRPYQIMGELEKQFRNISIPIAGRITLESFHHLSINKQFDGVRLVGSMTLFSSGK